MKRIAIAAVLALWFVSSGCSDDDSPADPGTFSQYQLHETYELSQNGRTDSYLTSDEHLMIRFRSATTDTEKNLLARKYKLTFAGEITFFGLTVTDVDGAIATSALLTQEPAVEYVGPIFINGMCGEELTWMCLTNGVIVHADQSDRLVVEALGLAHAKRVDTFTIDPRDALYRVPWADPQVQVDLVNRLETYPAVDYAQPNFLYRICLDDLTPGMTQSH